MDNVRTLNTTNDLKLSKNFGWYFSLILLSIFAIISFYEVYKYNPVVYVTKYIFILLFVFSITIRVKNRNIQSKKMFLMGITILIVSFISLYTMPFKTSAFYSEALTNITMYAIVTLLALFIFPKIRLEEFKSILTVFLVAVFILVTIPSLTNIPDMAHYTNINNRFRYISIFENPNELSRFALLGSLLSVRLWFLFQGVIKKSFFLFMLLANSYLIYLADSKTSLASLAVLVAVIIIAQIYRLLPTKFFLSIASFLGGGIILTVLYFINIIGVNLTTDLNDLTSGRVEIWLNILNTNALGLLFGTGPMTGLGSHNGYLEILKYFGIFGLILWAIIFMYLLTKKIVYAFNDKKREKYIGLGIVLLFFVYHLFEGSMVSIANIASIYFWLELTQRNE